MYYFDYVLLGYSALLPIANPLTSMTLLLSLGKGFTPTQRKSEINKASLYVFGILIVSFYAGTLLMNLLGISIPGLRIAGGLVLTYIGFTMLFPTSVNEAAHQTELAGDISPTRPVSIAFVPLAMPGTAGPGTIAMIVSGASTLKSGGDLTFFAHLAAMTVFALLALTFWLCLRSASSIVRFFGQSGIDAFARLMGFILICVGVQFLINGATEVVTSIK
ncbi:MarC family NAAT transporter [Pseudochelatococcus sp. G4_1912]|uniref:MarC family NAAT transporter n=1 Tax=Pseudochelatococcus sp. G4_1912 TaxID=3114288 RepID=UPI0039C68B16